MKTRYILIKVKSKYTTQSLKFHRAQRTFERSTTAYAIVFLLVFTVGLYVPNNFKFIRHAVNAKSERNHEKKI